MEVKCYDGRQHKADQWTLHNSTPCHATPLITAHTCDHFGVRQVEGKGGEAEIMQITRRGEKRGSALHVAREEGGPGRQAGGGNKQVRCLGRVGATGDEAVDIGADSVPASD
ncbi:hypothetical protein Pmani_020798 [Petrolisthes manimaculis]|uniref:Uncharacterized protein n=1 Tax=Petrolisthes manimaculis TaxID=1843537 RepID=A0AAE1PHI8_9EUCA|nr:hypothetical protein Pmani_020798 [Petrolisthes manimaculis]